MHKELHIPSGNDVAADGVVVRVSEISDDFMAQAVRRQCFWDRLRPDLREGLALLVGLIMRRICGEASAGFRWSFV